MSKVTGEKPAKKKKSAKQIAIEAARGYTKMKKVSVVGTVQNADPDFRYYYFDRYGIQKGREMRLRQTLTEKGYVESNDGEYVVGCDAVVFKIPREAYEILFAERCRLAEQRMNRLEHAKKERARTDAIGALEEAILEADPQVMKRLRGLLTE